MTKYLNLSDAIKLTGRLGFHIKDSGLLEAALARPRASAFGEDAYPEFELKIAAMMQSVIKNHALIDGNKRSAWLLAVSFMFLNGYKHNFTEELAFDLILGLATDKYEIEDAAKIIRKHLVKLK
jgi:death-on-curing protein